MVQAAGLIFLYFWAVLFLAIAHGEKLEIGVRKVRSIWGVLILVILILAVIMMGIGVESRIDKEIILSEVNDGQAY